MKEMLLVILKMFIMRIDKDFLDTACLHLASADLGIKPYVAPTIISLPQTTLLGALDSHDTLSVVEGNVVEGEQLYNIVHTNKDDVIDLGTLNYTLDDFRVYTSDLANVIKKEQGLMNIVCARFTPTSSLANMTNTNALLFVSSAGNISFSNMGYNATTFKTAMSGVMLQYEKEIPTQTIVAQDLHFYQISSIIEQGGTIEPIFEDVPPNITTTFVVKKAVGE